MRSLVLLPLLTAACGAASVASPVERIEVPSVVALQDVTPGAQVLATFEVANLGTATSRVRLSVAPPFFLATPVLTVPAGGVATGRIGIEAPGYDALEAVVSIDGPYQSTSFWVTATFDLDVDRDGFLANQAGGSDCDDRRADVSPAVLEVCDGIDNDCNGFIDDDAIDITTWYRDLDDDLWGDPTRVRVSCVAQDGWVDRKGDCDDQDALVNPDAAETWYDGVDQDCDGASDFDRDGDGYDNWLQGGTDCRDTNAAVHPGAEEIWYDGIDQDCDGASDYDQDGDGFDALASGGADCDDEVGSVSPTGVEIDDGLDQDCDLMIDEDFLARGDLLFVELHLDPNAPKAQYAELVNTSERTLDLVGMRLESGSEVITLPSLVLQPGDLALLCGDPDDSTCDADLPGDLKADALLLRAEDPLDEVDWSTWTLSTPATRTLQDASRTADANDDEAAWCSSDPSPGTDTACLVP